jgi:hypothetical protein
MGGRIYRPAQDCSRRYGFALSINEIVRLTESSYEEREVTRMLPRWAPDVIATHTINAAGNLTVVDGLVRRRRF